MSSPEKTIFDLSMSEKLQLLEDLWDDITSDPAAVRLPDWQKRAEPSKAEPAPKSWFCPFMG